MADIDVNGSTYRIGRMDARKQFHVGRRLAPLLAGVGGILASLPKAKAPPASEDKPAGAPGLPKEVDLSKVNLTKTFGPLAEALASMSDEDTDYILDACLGVVSRQQGNQFAPVMARGGGMMFDDIEMPTMMHLAFAVIMENLGGFFPARA